MVFANIYTKLNDLEQKVNALSGMSGISIDNTNNTDLSSINEKIAYLEGVATSLNEKISGLPSEYAQPQDVSSLFEKVNQMTNILAQFNMQINKLTERINALEQKPATEE